MMVRLALTTHAFAQAARLAHNLARELCAGRLLVVGGGGYRPEETVRCWLLLLGELAGMPAEELAQFHDLPPFPPAAPDAWAQIPARRW